MQLDQNRDRISPAAVEFAMAKSGAPADLGVIVVAMAFTAAGNAILKKPPIDDLPPALATAVEIAYSLGEQVGSLGVLPDGALGRVTSDGKVEPLAEMSLSDLLR